MVLETAFAHYQEDISRARQIMEHAETSEDATLKSDLLRSSWMFGVGACDAFFCDAYADLLSRTIRAKEFQTEISIPNKMNDLRVPVSTILRKRDDGWRWRMAARDLMERDNVLSINKIRRLFNQYFPSDGKLMTQETIESWILGPGSLVRLFAITPTQYRQLNDTKKNKAKMEATERLQKRFTAIFQRRHDCIHNCDRPKIAVQAITVPQVTKAIHDIDFLVTRHHEALSVEFPRYLERLGFSGHTRNRVGIAAIS